ncbi:MAG: hypothetical protein ACKO2P_02255 [Planctomycetota bacterium]
MLLVKKICGAVSTFLAAFLLVVGLGRAQSAGPAQLPVTLGLAVVFGSAGLWMLLAKPRSQASSR